MSSVDHGKSFIGGDLLDMMRDYCPIADRADLPGCNCMGNKDCELILNDECRKYRRLSKTTECLAYDGRSRV